MNKILCPSMMCANFGNLDREIEELEQSGIDIFHLDVMDGKFVPNFGMGLQDIEYICSHASKPCDVHLMIVNPGDYVKKFVDLGAKIIYVHPEADVQICRTLQTIRDLGAIPGIALNPGTSFEAVKDYLVLCDYILIMSVNPGFSGQKYLEFLTPKIQKFVDESENYGGYKVILDGACSKEKITELSEMGVEGFVLGTSALFGKEENYNTICASLRCS